MSFRVRAWRVIRIQCEQRPTALMSREELQKLMRRKMKLTGYRNVFLALASLGGLSVVGRTAEAQRSQFHPSVYGSADIGTRHSQFYLLGLYVGVGGLGWSPYFNVN